MTFTRGIRLLRERRKSLATRQAFRSALGRAVAKLSSLSGCLPIVAFLSCWLLGATSFAQSIPVGYEIVVIADDLRLNVFPRMNNRGAVVWLKRLVDADPASQEIYLWEHGRTRRLTNNDRYDVLPQINDHGTIAWAGRTGTSASTYEVFRLSNGRVEQVTSDDQQDVLCAMNQAGHMVWYTNTPDGCSSSRLSVYENGVATIITDSQLRNDDAAINDSGAIVYNSRNFCVSPWIGSTWLQRNNSTLQLAPWTPGGSSLPSINNTGQITWHLAGQGPGTLWDDGVIAQLTYEGRPLLNNRKQVVVSGRPNAGDLEGIWRLESGQWNLLTTAFGVEQTNDRGELLLSFRPPGGSAFSVSLAIMRRLGHPGDVDNDGDVDLDDAIVFQLCLSGQDAPFLVGCAPSDFDRDGDVDEFDYQVLTAAMAGPRFPGDVDYDGDVDLEDYARMERCMALEGTVSTPPCWSSDANRDGTVDHLDASLVLEHFSGPRN